MTNYSKKDLTRQLFDPRRIMKLSKILIAVSLIFMSLTAVDINAEPQTHQQREKWFEEMTIAKIDFLAKQMSLTPTQRSRFEKDYRAMTAETAKLSRETRSLEHNVSKKKKATDLEYEKAAEAIAEFKGKESAIEMKYFRQFKTYLSNQQLFLLKKSEGKWMREIMGKRGRKK